MLIDEIKALDLLLVKLSRRDKEALTILNELHAKVFGIPIKWNCNNCVQKAYKKLSSLTELELEKMATRQFELKAGKLIRLAYTGKFYTNENITDDDALKLLKESPERIRLFSKFPKNWAKMEVEKPKEDLTLLTAKVLKEMYLEKKGEVAPLVISKADLISLINE